MPWLVVEVVWISSEIHFPGLLVHHQVPILILTMSTGNFTQLSVCEAQVYGFCTSPSTPT